MNKNELIARLLARRQTSGANRELCFAAANRNLCFAATAGRSLCFAAVDRRPAQATPAR